MSNTSPSSSREVMDLLSRMLLSPAPVDVAQLQNMSPEQFKGFLSLAHSNHVVIRAMEVYRELMQQANDSVGVHVAEEVLGAEHARIGHALSHLRGICDVFVRAGLDLTVIKTLDHWPDFGSDIDLYTGSNPQTVCNLMQQRFGAEMEARSWGDRMAGKWNFAIPGLPESVEIHMCRLGQTGEQLKLAENVPARSRMLQFGEQTFRVASASDRIMISTLQRMYRHFYFRLCDILDSAALVTSGEVDFADLNQQATACGIWEGVATYLVLVSDYVQKYHGTGIDLRKFVRAAARFDGRVMYTGGEFLRVPIMPQAAGLYQSQLLGLLKRGEIHSGARLSVLPWLATAAAVGYKITGSDKGIW